MSWQTAVESFRRTTTAKGRAQSGLFGIEGVRLVERAVRAGAEIVQVITTADFAATSPRHATLIDTLTTNGYNPTLIPASSMAELVQGRGLGKIVAVLRLPQPPTLAKLVATTPCILLAAVEVVDPGNVGAMVRTAHGLGGTAVLTVGVSDAYHPKAVRTSMGSLFKLPILHYPNIAALQTDLATANIQTVATVATDGQPLPTAKLPRERLAVLMGNEYWGLDEEALTAVHHRITIPMHPDIDSFSVNAAAAIVLYELQRNSNQTVAEPATMGLSNKETHR